ncbi:transposase, MuDR, MULE transposase domain protein, partial [Tanacetum coccineum]
MNCDIDIKVPSMNCDIDIKVPLFTKNETFENNEAADMYEPLWAKNTLKYIPTPPNPQPIIKPTRDTSIHAARILKKGDRFDSKELCMYEIGYKALLDGYQFKTRKSDTTRYDVICRNDDCNWKIISSKCKGSSKWELGTVHDHHTCPKTQIGMHHRNATAKLLGRLLEPKFKDNTRIYKGKDIKQDIYTDMNIDISYKQAWRAKNVALEYISGCPVASFAQLPYYCHNLELTNDGTVTHIETDDEDRFKMVFIAFGVVIRSFKYHMRPLIIIDAAHLKGRYEGTNLLAVGMDGNNQIIPIATGVSQGETGPSWTWFLSKLKECIGEIPNLTIISDRHAAILSSCEAVFPNAFHGYCCRHLMMNCKLKSIKMQCLFWKMCKAYTVEDFRMAINELGSKRPDVYEKLIEAGVERWSRAYCPRDRYNYMTSNSAESINNLTRDVRKVSITNLMEWYRNLVQRWYCERR